MPDTKIEWATKVWNPVTGCTKVSAGCKNCYAERMATRLAGRVGYDAGHPFRVTLHPERLTIPSAWRKPQRVFVNSMSDLFHELVPDDFILDTFVAMAVNPQHNFLILTKRPRRMLEWTGWFRSLRYSPHDHHAEARISIGNLPLANVWLGVSAEDQTSAEERIPLLLQTPAAVRFVSYEPALGPLDLRGMLPDPLDGAAHVAGRDLPPIDWVICGGESGPLARPMHPAWARSLRDQCQSAGVPFFFKQWGEWLPISQMDDSDHLYHPAPERDPEAIRQCKVKHTVLTTDGEQGDDYPPGAMMVFNVGKRSAGALLDGCEHKEFPK